MRRYFLLFSLCFISLSSQAFTWKDLWWTNDQQGNTLMQQNAYQQAEETFSNPAWKAAAAYKAGNYSEAARRYESLPSPDYYNLGNARAQLGQYEAAIKAYEQALQINADDMDAKYNKKLVEELLKQQQEQKNQQKQDQQKQDQQKQDQQKQDQEKQDQQKQDQQKQDQQKQDQQKQDQEKQDQEKQDQEKQDQEKQDQQKQDQQKQDQQKQDQQKQDQEKQDQQKQDQEKQDQQKAEASEAQENLDDKEKKAAREQWLQLIPDDPGGLMRQKFLRDYLKRHRPSGY